jgi:hypothetical protein
MALYLLILPLLRRALAEKWSMSPPIIDLWIARGSSLFGVLGPILLGVASGPILLVLCTFTLPCFLKPSLLMTNSTCSFHLFIGISVFHSVIRDIISRTS